MKDTSVDLATLDLDRHAFFFDFDGTLAEFTNRPQDASISDRLRDDLLRLSERTGGAVAIISGAEIARRAFLVGVLFILVVFLTVG